MTKNFLNLNTDVMQYAHTIVSIQRRDSMPWRSHAEPRK